MYYAAAFVIVLVILALTFALGRYTAGRPLREALRRAQLRMRSARFLIYRNWEEADSLLGVGERDAARALRSVVVPDAHQPTYEELQMFVAAHQQTYLEDHPH